MAHSDERLTVRCPQPGCGTKLKVSAEMAGKRVRCPKCKAALRVPGAPAPEAQPATEAPAPAVAAGPSGPLKVASWIRGITEGRPRWRTALGWALPASLAIHLACSPIALQENALKAQQLKELETEYSRKIAAAKRASQTARELKNTITMPPPPPDPEAVISNTLNSTISSDISKVVSGVAEVELQQKLVAHVAASLKDELDAAAKKMAKGEMSQEELEALQKKYRQKAHEEAVKALKEHRVETQLERAAKTTTEWYEDSVAGTLFKNMSFVLFNPPGYSGHPQSPQRWHHVFSGVYTGWTEHPNWSRLAADDFLRNKLADLETLVEGPMEHYQDPETKKRERRRHPGWPGPGEAQAKKLEESLQAIFKGGGKISHGQVSYPTPSWRNAIYGETDTVEAEAKKAFTHMSDGILDEFYPHKKDQVKPAVAELDGLWEKLLAAAEAYRRSAESGAAEDDLAGQRDDAFKLIQAIVAKAKPLVPADKNLAEINWALRVDLLAGPKREAMYEKWVTQLLEGLDPMIRDFARSQFKSGIIAHKDGVEQAIKEFPKTILPLMRRDLERMLPARKFNAAIFAAPYPHRQYKNPVTNERTNEPTEDDIKKERQALQALLSQKPEYKAYAEKRRALLEQRFEQAIHNVAEDLLTNVLSGGLMMKQMATFVEGADYADKVQEKLDARQAALQGRGQDLAKLTKEGVPDTSAPLIALLFGLPKGHGASLEPVETTLAPNFVLKSRPEMALRQDKPAFPPIPAKWGFEVEQFSTKPEFPSPRFEAIPFLAQFPRLDGELSDWGKVRPLILQGAAKGKEIAVYAGWNYQGFFFAYDVKAPFEKFYYPEWRRDSKLNAAYAGDSLRLLFDTLDARNTNRGEPHTQDFLVLPLGSDTNPDLPGLERIVASQRDAKTKEWRGVKADQKVFNSQPPAEYGPDGSGPYRITRIRDTGPLEAQGYTVEVFIPRRLFAVPVFAPGWHIGFDCVVATGNQKRPNAQYWASGENVQGADAGGNRPNTWGDVLLLGTDARVLIQEASPKGEISHGVIPGHSYLLTVIDPDRNVSLASEDSVLVSAEVMGAGAGGDVEVFILKETEKNSSIFRGYVNTQPGKGREVQGVLEVMAGQQVRFGYLDFGDAKGRRNVASELRLPVVSSLMELSPKIK